MPNDTREWAAVLARIVALEHDIYNWDSLLATMGSGTPDMEVRRAEAIRANSQRELSELRELLGQAQQASHADKINLSLRISAIAVAIYAALMLVILIYLVAMAR